MVRIAATVKVERVGKSAAIVALGSAIEATESWWFRS